MSFQNVVSWLRQAVNFGSFDFEDFDIFSEDWTEDSFGDGPFDA